MAKLTLDPLATLRQDSALTQLNENFDAIETAMEATLTRSGTSPNEMESDLDMNSNRILNLPGALSPTEPLRLTDMEDSLEIALQNVDLEIDGTASFTTPGATTSRNLFGRSRDNVHLMDFGAVGDGVTDDTAAINLALAYVRAAAEDDEKGNRVVLNGGGRMYYVSGSLNGTDIRGNKNWGLRDIFIKAQNNGKVVLDLLGSRFGHLENVYIWGEETSACYTGIQIGRGSYSGTDPSAGEFLFTNVSVDGYFANAALHVYASELNVFTQCRFWNKKSLSGVVGANAYCMIMDDGQGNQEPMSDYLAFNNPLLSGAFNLNTFVGCDFRKTTPATGPCIWISGTNSHRYIGCYAAANNQQIFHVYMAAGSVTQDLYVDMHTETTGLQDIFNFEGTTGLTIEGLTFIGHKAGGERSVFRVADATSLTINDLNCRIQNWESTPTNGVFGDPTKVTLKGANIFIPNLSDFGTWDSYASLSGVKVQATDGVRQTNVEVFSDDTDAAVGPNLDVYRSRAAPADGDHLGAIRIRGNDDAGNATAFASVRGSAVDVTNGTEDGRITLMAMINGTLTEVFRVQHDQAAIWISNSFRDITVGAADSGGAGFRLLRVPNS